MPARSAIARPALAALAAGLLLGCLKEAPIVQPARVYDPETAIRQSRFAGLDSIEVFLIDVADSGRIIRLWGGPPGERSRLPTHTAAEGEAFYFRVDGYRAGRGLCYSEIIREGTAVVALDTCEARQVPRFRHSVIALGDAGPSLVLSALIDLPGKYRGRLECVPDDPWIGTGPISQGTAQPADSIASCLIEASTGMLDLGPHEGLILLRDEKGLHDSLVIRFRTVRVRVFTDSVARFGNTQDTLVFEARAPYTEDPAWPGQPQVPWLKVGIHPDSKSVPGQTVRMQAVANPDRAPAPKGRFSTWYHAMGKGRTPIDSIRIELPMEDWPGGIHGTVRDWNKGNAVPGARVELFHGDSTKPMDSATTGGDGAYAFPSLRAGAYRLAASAPARLGGYQDIKVSERDTACNLRVSPIQSFKPVDMPWGGERRIGAVAVIEGQALVASQSATEPGEVLAVSLLDSGKRSTFPQENAAGPGRWMRAAELAGNSTYLVISYPADSTLGLIYGWGTADQRVTSLKVPFQPYGLHFENQVLAAAGWQNENQVVFGLFEVRVEGGAEGPTVLRTVRLDTLAAKRSGRDTLGSGPLVASDLAGHYFIGDGALGGGKVLVRSASGPTPPTHASWLATTAANGLTYHQGLLYVASNGFVRMGLRSGLLDPQVANMVITGQRTLRIAAGDFLGMRTYAFATVQSSTQEDSLLVLSPHHAWPLGKLGLPGALQARGVATLWKAGRVVANDERRLYVLEAER